MHRGDLPDSLVALLLDPGQTLPGDLLHAAAAARSRCGGTSPPAPPGVPSRAAPRRRSASAAPAQCVSALPLMELSLS